MDGNRAMAASFESGEEPDFMELAAKYRKERDARDAEIARLRSDLSEEETSTCQVIDERDSAENVIQREHVILGGDGEWSSSSDLRAEILAMAGEVRAEVARLTAENEELHKGQLSGSTMTACPNCGAGTRPRYLRDGHCVECVPGLLADNKRLRGALEFYAKHAPWEESCTGGPLHFEDVSVMHDDGGDVARTALKGENDGTA